MSYGYNSQNLSSFAAHFLPTVYFSLLQRSQFLPLLRNCAVQDTLHVGLICCVSCFCFAILRRNREAPSSSASVSKQSSHDVHSVPVVWPFGDVSRFFLKIGLIYSSILLFPNKYINPLWNLFDFLNFVVAYIANCIKSFLLYFCGIIHAHQPDIR